MAAKNRVLVVDDDAVVGGSIKRVLTEKGYEVQESPGGAEALAELDHQSYDMVFTDIRMPGMDGLEVTSRVKKAHPGVPVVIITGYGTEANEAKARELGVTAFLHKPLTPSMIMENAERALSERREMQEAIRLSALALASPAVTAAPAQQHVSVGKNLALFFAAPFIGLGYIVAFPFVGFWALGKHAFKALAGSR